MYRILYASLFALLFAVPCTGQYYPDKLWAMEEAGEIKQILRSPSMEPDLRNGLFDQAIYLDGKNTELNLGGVFKTGEPITVSFWLKPEQFYGEQSLIQQSRISNTAKSETNRMIEVFLNDHWARTRTEKGMQSGELPNVNVLAKGDNGWLFFTYTGSEFGYQVFIQGQEVVESNDGTMFQDLGDFTNQLVIGHGKSHFIGLIDELKIFYERLDSYAINAILEEDRKRMQSTTTEKIESDITSTTATTAKENQEEETAKQGEASKSISESIPPLEVTSSKGVVLVQTEEDPALQELPKEGQDSLVKNRKVKIHSESLIVNDKTIRLKIWDSYKRIDDDRVSIFLNTENDRIDSGVLLKKKRRYEEIEIKLADQEENLLIFFAEHMGNYYSSASIAVQIEGYEKVFKLSANNEENAALKILQKKVKKPTLGKLANVITEEESVQIEFSKSRNSAPDSKHSIRLKAEGTPGFYSIFLEDEAQSLDLDFASDESKKISIEKNQNWGSGKASDPVKMIIRDEKGELKRHALFLDRKFYEFSITRKGVYEVVNNGQREIKIPKDIKEVTLEISDHDRPDEDKITIYYDNKLVVEKQELFKKPVDVVVPLNPSLIKHRLSINTDSFGTSPEPINTPRIRVLVDGKEVDSFVFSLRKEKNGGGAVIDLVVE